MIFSSIEAGVDQSIRRSTRKPRLNHDENKWTKSLSMTERSSRWSIASSRFSRIRTSAAVPPGARLRRRKSSSRRGSLARCSSAAASAEGYSRHASIARVDARPFVSESSRKRLEKRDPRPGCQRRIIGQYFVGQRHTGGLAPAGKQRFAQLDQAFRVARAPARGVRAGSRHGCGRRCFAACR